jgi:hypothetical protein
VKNETRDPALFEEHPVAVTSNKNLPVLPYVTYLAQKVPAGSFSAVPEIWSTPRFPESHTDPVYSNP